MDVIVLCAGDCGSWVVDDETFEVYGHVVASDAFGEAFIIPLDAIFQDMKTQLEVESVSLPAETDINEVITQRGKTSTMNNICIVPGKSMFCPETDLIF